MKKKYSVILGMFVLLMLWGCGKEADKNATDNDATITAEENLGDNKETLANPMTETTLEKINKLYPVTLSDDMLDVQCYFIEVQGEEPMSEINFTYKDDTYCYRIQSTSEEKDISGMYFDWEVNETTTVGYNEGKVSYNQEKEGIINWYDAAPGLMYSISMENGADLEKLETMANLIYQPAQGGN